MFYHLTLDHDEHTIQMPNLLGRAFSLGCIIPGRTFNVSGPIHEDNGLTNELDPKQNHIALEPIGVRKGNSVNRSLIPTKYNCPDST